MWGPQGCGSGSDSLCLIYFSPVPPGGLYSPRRPLCSPVKSQLFPPKIQEGCSESLLPKSIALHVSSSRGRVECGFKECGQGLGPKRGDEAAESSSADKHQGQSGGSRNGLGACTDRTRSPGPGVDIAGCGGRRKWEEGVGAADPTKGSLVRSLDFLPKQGSPLGSVKQGWDLPISS